MNDKKIIIADNGDEYEVFLREDGHYSFYDTGSFSGMLGDPDPYGTGFDSRSMLKNEIESTLYSFQDIYHEYRDTQDYKDTVRYYRDCLDSVFA